MLPFRPPTPPYVRTRIRRFMKTQARRADRRDCGNPCERAERSSPRMAVAGHPSVRKTAKIDQNPAETHPTVAFGKHPNSGFGALDALRGDAQIRSSLRSRKLATDATTRSPARSLKNFSRSRSTTRLYPSDTCLRADSSARCALLPGRKP